MEQLLLELFQPAPPTFASYVVGLNDEPVAALKAFVTAQQTRLQTPTSFYLWGGKGAGKTHLLAAAAAMATDLSMPVHRLQPTLPELPGPNDPTALWLFDDVHNADAQQQSYLFTLYNRLRLPESNGGALIVTSEVPPAQLSLREDTRTRMGWGAIYEIVRLNDDDKPKALQQYAQTRGLPLSEETIAYLMKNAARDMRSLVMLIDAIDRYSRINKRSITLPLVRVAAMSQSAITSSGRDL